jgi:hypothetical protein
MTSQEFTAQARRLGNVSVVSTLGNLEFHAKGVVFATLGSPDVSRAVLRLTSEAQAEFIALSGSMFSAEEGGAGARGVTRVRLLGCDADLMRRALAAAHEKASLAAGRAPVKPTPRR